MAQVHNFRTPTPAEADHNQVPPVQHRWRIVELLMLGGILLIGCICWIVSLGTMWTYEERSEDGSPNVDER